MLPHAVPRLLLLASLALTGTLGCAGARVTTTEVYVFDASGAGPQDAELAVFARPAPPRTIWTVRRLAAPAGRAVFTHQPVLEAAPPDHAVEAFSAGFQPSWRVGPLATAAPDAVPAAGASPVFFWRELPEREHLFVLLLPQNAKPDLYSVAVAPYTPGAGSRPTSPVAASRQRQFVQARVTTLLSDAWRAAVTAGALPDDAELEATFRARVAEAFGVDRLDLRLIFAVVLPPAPDNPAGLGSISLAAFGRRLSLEPLIERAAALAMTVLREAGRDSFVASGPPAFARAIRRRHNAYHERGLPPKAFGWPALEVTRAGLTPPRSEVPRQDTP